MRYIPNYERRPSWAYRKLAPSLARSEKTGPQGLLRCNHIAS